MPRAPKRTEPATRFRTGFSRTSPERGFGVRLVLVGQRDARPLTSPSPHATDTLSGPPPACLAGAGLRRAPRVGCQCDARPLTSPSPHATDTLSRPPAYLAGAGLRRAPRVGCQCGAVGGVRSRRRDGV